MRLHPEQIGLGDWRRFEWTFTTPASLSGEIPVVLFTMSERPIQVRNISLCALRGEQTQLRYFGYQEKTILPPVHPGDSNIVIYENIQTGPWSPTETMSPEKAEEFKWGFDPATTANVPDIGFSQGMRYNPTQILYFITLPSIGIYILGLFHFGIRFFR